MEGLVQGSIVLVSVCDPSGKNKKERPALILTPTAQIQTEEILFAVPVSHTSAMQKPRPSTFIALPWHKEGKCKTKLTAESVAVCDEKWRLKIEKAKIIKRIGFCHPPDVLERILELTGAASPKTH